MYSKGGSGLSGTSLSHTGSIYLTVTKLSLKTNVKMLPARNDGWASCLVGEISDMMAREVLDKTKFSYGD